MLVSASRDAVDRITAEWNSVRPDLDVSPIEVIGRISEPSASDQLQLKRIKKRKLRLKDEIAKIESPLRPDIIA